MIISTYIITATYSVCFCMSLSLSLSLPPFLITSWSPFEGSSGAEGEQVFHIASLYVFLVGGFNMFQPLWKILVSLDYYSQYMEKMFQTSNQFCISYIFFWTQVFKIIKKTKLTWLHAKKCWLVLSPLYYAHHWSIMDNKIREIYVLTMILNHITILVGEIMLPSGILT